MNEFGTGRQSNSIISNMLDIVSPEIAVEVFKEKVEPYYLHFTADVEKYKELVHDDTCYLDHKMIRILVQRLSYCTHLADNFLKTVGGGSQEKNNPVTLALSEAAWELQLIAENHLDSLFRKSSLGMKYFPETFKAIEEVDPNKLRKGVAENIRSQVIGNILEIAGKERDSAIKKCRPKLGKIVGNYTKQVSNITQEILDSIAKRSLFSKGEIRGYNNSLSQINSAGFLIMRGDLKGLHGFVPNDFSSYGHGLNQVFEEHQNRIFVCLGEFLAEENELQQRLRKGLGVRGKYRPADIDIFLSPELPEIN